MFNMYLGWYSSPADWNFVNTIVTTLRDELLLILGHISGASVPEGVKSAILKNQKPTIEINETNVH